MYPITLNSQSFQVCPPSSVAPEKEEEGETTPIFVAHILTGAWLNLSGQPQKQNKTSPSLLAPVPEIINCRGLHFQDPYHNFWELSLTAFFLGCYFSGEWVEGLSQKPSTSLFLKCESTVIAAKVASLALYCEQEHRSWTPGGFLGTAQTSTWLTKIT